MVQECASSLLLKTVNSKGEEVDIHEADDLDEDDAEDREPDAEVDEETAFVSNVDQGAATEDPAPVVNVECT